MIRLIYLFLFLFGWCGLMAFPYYVSPDVLEDVATYKEQYEKSPTDNNVMFDLAMSYAYSGQILKGWMLLKKIPPSYSSTVIDTNTKLMLEHPTEWRYPFKSAFGYFFSGDKEKAIEMFHRVIDLYPEQVWAYGFIGLVYGEMGDIDQAISYCKRGLRIEPNATAIHFLLGEGYRKKKKYFKAFRQFLKVGRLQDKSKDQ